MVLPALAYTHTVSLIRLLYMCLTKVTNFFAFKNIKQQKKGICFSSFMVVAVASAGSTSKPNIHYASVVKQQPKQPQQPPSAMCPVYELTCAEDVE